MRTAGGWALVILVIASGDDNVMGRLAITAIASRSNIVIAIAIAIANEDDCAMGRLVVVAIANAECGRTCSNYFALSGLLLLCRWFHFSQSAASFVFAFPCFRSRLRRLRTIALPLGIGGHYA